MDGSQFLVDGVCAHCGLCVTNACASRGFTTECSFSLLSFICHLDPFFRFATSVAFFWFSAPLTSSLRQLGHVSRTSFTVTCSVWFSEAVWLQFQLQCQCRFRPLGGFLTLREGGEPFFQLWKFGCVHDEHVICSRFSQQRQDSLSWIPNKSFCLIS